MKTDAGVCEGTVLPAGEDGIALVGLAQRVGGRVIGRSAKEGKGRISGIRG